MKGDRIMVKDYYSIEELAENLDICAESADGLFNGVIEFEADELYHLAVHKSITICQLLQE